MKKIIKKLIARIIKRLYITMFNTPYFYGQNEIKVGNNASIRIAEFAGMRFDHQDGNILHYKRSALE